MAQTSQPTTKGGNIILRRVSVPNSVEPGENYEVDVLVSNGAGYIGPWDPDRCFEGNYDGYKLSVMLEGPNGEVEPKGPVCHKRTTVGTKDETYTFEVRAPESGRAEVSAYVQMEKSGKRTDALEASSLVASGEPKQPDTGSNDDGGGGSDFFGGSPDPSPGGSPSLDSYAKGGAVLLGLLAIAWLADSGADIAGG